MEYCFPIVMRFMIRNMMQKHVCFYLRVYLVNQENRAHQEEVGEKEIRDHPVPQVLGVQLGKKAPKEIRERSEIQEHLACQVRREVLGSRVAW